MVRVGEKDKAVRMAIFTQDELLGLKKEWKAAAVACASGRSYSIDGRSLTRQDMSDIIAMLEWIEMQIAGLDGRGSMAARPMRNR